MNLQHQRILQTAVHLGIAVTELVDCGEEQAAWLHFGDRDELVVDGHVLSLMTLRNKRLCDNKQLTKRLFAQLGLPSPTSLVFRDPMAEQERIAAFFEPNRVCVCKPLDGGGGTDVVMDIGSFEELYDTWKERCQRHTVFLLEAQQPGYDLRLQALDGRLVAACIREPAVVIGDGRRSVATLIQARQAVIATQNPANRLGVDAQMLDLLREQGLTLTSIPASGQRVQLGRLANMSLGASARDVTDEAHPCFSVWVERIAEKTGMPFFALDVITKDHRLDAPEMAWALEVNALPEWLHHTFSDGRQHDIARLLLNAVFGLSGLPVDRLIGVMARLPIGAT